MFDAIRHRLLNAWADVVTLYPWRVLIVCSMFAVIGIALAATQLSFQPNRNDLLDDDLIWNQRFIDWQQSFSGSGDLLVVIDTQSETGQDIESLALEAMSETAAALEQLPSIKRVVWGFDPLAMPADAITLLPGEAFKDALTQLSAATPLLQSPRIEDLFTTSLADRASNADQFSINSVDAQQLLELLQLIEESLREGVSSNPFEPFFNPSDTERWQALRTPNERLLIMLVTPEPTVGALNPYEEAIRATRNVVQTVQDHPRYDYASLAMGLTGIEVIEHDETAGVTRDSTIASIVAAVFIAILLMLGFQSVRLPLMLMAALFIGIAWTFGFLTLAVGHLQVISVVFTVILLGLGVGFGIHLASRIELVRHNYPDTLQGFHDTIRDTLRTMGPGITTGAITTAAAFCTTLLTDFKGVAEMGLIAAAGIMLCLIAMFSVYPALARLFKPNHADTVHLNDRWVHFYEDRWVQPFARKPKFTLIMTALLMIAACTALTQLRFDYNLLALLPARQTSVQWQERVVRDGEQSVYFGVSRVDTIAEAQALMAAYRALPNVESFGGIGRLLPEDADEKQLALAALINPLLDITKTTSPSTGNLLQQLVTLRQLLSFAVLQPQLDDEARRLLMQSQQRIDDTLAVSRELSDDVRTARLDDLQQSYADFRETTITKLRSMIDDEPLQIADLPPAITASFASTTSRPRYTLEIYPKLPPDVNDPLDPAFLGPFIRDMRSIDPAVTGVIVQIYESGQLIWRSYLFAGALAFVIVFLLVFLDFRNVIDAALTLLPVAIGFAMTFGLMVLVGMSLNPANIIVLPLMFGLGVDAGVHMLHRYRQHGNLDQTDHQPLGLSHGTGKAISLTSYTAIIGFAAMMLADHRGIFSLGFTLATGIAFTLLACWLVLPAVLRLRAIMTAPSQPAATQRVADG